MPCPVTLGFFHSLEHSPLSTLRESFEFVVDAQGTYPSLRVEATRELPMADVVYAKRAFYTIQLTTTFMAVRSPNVMAGIIAEKTAEEMMRAVVELKDDVEDLLLVSRMQRKSSGGDGQVMHRMDERLVIREALKGLEAQLEGCLTKNFKKVGFALGDTFRGLYLPKEQSLKIGRKILAIKE